jgi:hypothetical protein
MIALAGIVAVGVLLLAAWKLNPSSDRQQPPLPPVPGKTSTGVSGLNQSSYQATKAQQTAADKKNHVTVAPKTKPVTLRVDATTAKGSWIVIRRLSDPTKIVFQNTLVGPNHIGGKMQHDPKGYLITAACNPTALSLTVNGTMFALGSGDGPWKVTSAGVVPTRAPAGIPAGGC